MTCRCVPPGMLAPASAIVAAPSIGFAVEAPAAQPLPGVTITARQDPPPWWVLVLLLVLLLLAARRRQRGR